MLPGNTFSYAKLNIERQVKQRLYNIFTDAP